MKPAILFNFKPCPSPLPAGHLVSVGLHASLTMAPESQKEPHFPTTPFSHGAAIATVIVGGGSQQHNFTIHKQLLSKASAYFDRALNGEFQESNGIIKLHHHCPIAFEVLYQWLYAGKVFAPTDFQNPGVLELYYNPGPWHQMYWLRLFKIADETMMAPLKKAAYQHLTANCFGRVMGEMPDVGFLKSIFDPEGPELVLQQYLVQYAAYIMPSRCSKDAPVWQAAFKEVPEYAVLVLHQIAEWSDSINKKAIQHPLDNPELASGKVCSLTLTLKLAPWGLLTIVKTLEMNQGCWA